MLQVENKMLCYVMLCICLSNLSNILFPDCGHLCLCENCNNNLIELKCPMCRTAVTQQRIII